MEKTDQEIVYENEQINNIFPNAQFEVAINITELNKLISDKQFIIVKNTYSCFCYDNCKKNTDYFYIQGQNMTYRYVIEQLIYQGLQLDCDHRYLEGFYKKDDSDCQFEMWTGS
jgi:hypothetical protein